MKKLKWILGTVALVFSVGVKAQLAPLPPVISEPTPEIQGSSDVDSLRQSGDDFVPWPFGSEMPFPWSFVQGVWLAEHGEFKSYFAFRVVQTSTVGLQQLEVHQIDPVTCELVAKGAGFEQNRIVRAQMTDIAGKVYRVSLRSFHETSIQSPIGTKPVNGQYVVLSILPFDTTSKTVHMPIAQITRQINFRCQVQM